MTVSSSTWTYADPESRAWWGGLWADRVRYSGFAEQARRIRTERQPTSCSASPTPGCAGPTRDDAVIVIPHVEILARG